MLERASRKVRYAALLFKIGGPGAFVPQLKRQIFSQDILFGLEKDLNTGDAKVPCRVDYTLDVASEKDIEELLLKAKTESKQSIHELVERKWFYESGFRDCFIARTADTGEICFVAWLVSSKDSGPVSRGFSSRLPHLENDEILLENCYTFEKYRGNGLMPSVVLKLWAIARARGYRRMITYVRRDNAASLKGFDKLGLKSFEAVLELKLLFFTRRNHNLDTKAVS